MKILDNQKSEWRVTGGDPAMKAVNLLKRHGYELIVLPVKTLASGERPTEKPVIEDLILNLRLNECLLVLEEKLWTSTTRS
jgi:hypothetical protein